MRVPLIALLVLITPSYGFRAEEMPFRVGTGIDIPLPDPGCTVIVTGYNSVPEQTDDTPFITASQTHTRPGVVAARWLPFGAKVQFPGHFDDKVFVVEDRMPRRHWCKMDIWFEGLDDANQWGIRKVFIRVLEPRGFQCPSQPVSVRHKCPEPS